MNLLHIARLLAILLLVGSCSSDRWETDYSDVQYKGEFKRLDLDLFSMIDKNEEVQQSELQYLEGTYGNFLSIYLTEIMQMGTVSNPMTVELLKRFVQDPTWLELQKRIEEVHPDLSNEAFRLEVALKRYGAFFDEGELPQLVAYNSGFNFGIFPTDEWIGVGLEWYSGDDNPIVRQLPVDLFPKYKRENFKPEYLVPNALKGWLLFKYQNIIEKDDLLHQMVHRGKILALTNILLQDEQEENLLNFSPREVAWCRENEYDIWKFLVENDMIFSVDPIAVGKLMNDGPFTPGMPEESPGGVGVWIGLRMVDQYVDRHPELTLKELLFNTSARAILENYKPGK